jgi:hypothetical protein
VKTTLNTLPVFIILDWKQKFHVHTGASNYAIRAMLVQNHDNTINKPIYYVNQMMNGTKKNYSIIEKETLAMIYAIKKFRHYLLENNLTFFVDHQALIYLINKPTITR